MTDVNELISKMQRNDYTGFEYGDLERALAAAPDQCVKVAWQSLMSLDNYAVPGCGPICLDLWDLLKKANAIDEGLIIREWPKMNWSARTNVCYALAFSELLSTELGVALFENQSSTADDRYLIVSELTRPTRQDKPNKTVVLDMLSRIGRFDDPAQQRNLERFVKAVTLEYQEHDELHGGGIIQTSDHAAEPVASL